MQEGTQEDQHIRQSAEDVRSVLGHQEKRRNGEKGEQDQPAWRPESASLLRYMVRWHRFLLLTPASQALPMAHDRSGHGRPWVYGLRLWPWHSRRMVDRDRIGCMSDRQHRGGWRDAAGLPLR
jgi:hypothetical protein